MTNDDNMKDELQEMRLEMARLREELERQKIITDETLRKAMVSRTSWLGKFVKFELWSAPITIMILAMPSIAYGMSWWPLIAVVAMLLPSLWLDSKTVSIPEEKILHCSFTELRRFIIKQTRWRNIQFAVEMLLCIPWMGWYVYEYVRAAVDLFDPSHFKWVFIWIFGFTAVVTIIAVVVIYRKIARTNRELLRSIGESE